MKFDRNGRFIMEWGRPGNGACGTGEFSSLHALDIDSQGRLFIGDRDNNRIQIYDQDGNYLDCWYQFSRPSGIYIDADDRALRQLMRIQIPDGVKISIQIQSK